MLVDSAETRIILVGVRGWYQNGWTEAKYCSHIEETDEECWSWRPNFIFSTTCDWNALNVNASRTKSLLMNREECSNHECLLNQMKITRVGKTSRQDGRVVLRHRRTCSKMRWEVLWTGEQKDSAVKQSQVLAWMTTISRKRNLNQLEKCRKYLHKLSLKCLYLARSGRPDILWSSNKFAPSVTKWTGAEDIRIARLLSYIHHTRTTDNIVMWETRLSIVDWVHSKTQILLATLRTQNQPRGESYVYSEVQHSFPSVGCARNKRQYLTVLQNQKIISLEAGLRMDGLSAVDLWDVVTEVLR